MIQIFLFYLNNAEIICGDRLEHMMSLSPLNPIKAPGPDGFVPEFLKSWPIWW